MGKASKVIRDEKKKKKKLIVKKVVSQFYLVLICSFPKTVRNLRIGKPYFASRADKGEGSVFVVEDG